MNFQIFEKLVENIKLKFKKYLEKGELVVSPEKLSMESLTENAL